MALYLHTSNRLEILAERLADLVSGQPLPPLVPERIVVQSRGMARWLALFLSSDLGIWANADCPFPNVFLAEIMSPEAPQPADDRQTMTWRLMGLLAEGEGRSGSSELDGYLEGADDQKRFLFAWQLADLFDQYLMYRPDLIKAWEEGRDSGFQAELWRRLVRNQSGPHRANLLDRCLATLSRPDFDPVGLPVRVSVFGVSSLPPYHLELFHALSRHVDVYFFLMNPCRDYWKHIKSAREAARISRQHGNRPAEELHIELGNSLLAEFGHQGRDFFGLLHEFEECAEDSSFDEPGQGTLLASVQADILNLIEASPLAPAAAGDDSFRFVSCHGPMREVETLKDHLLGLLARRPDLSPSDILVMTPDIETYGPLAQAVFDAAAGDPLRLPYSIADRGQRAGSRLLAGFFSMLDLADSRFEVTRVLGLLDIGAVRRRFNLTEADLDRIRGWIAEVSIRWGLDRHEREELDLPGFSEYSWENGLDRLLLGWAMGSECKMGFGGLLPAAAVAGTEAPVLGRFLEFFDTVAGLAARLKGSYALDGWADLLANLVDVLFQGDEEEATELPSLRQAIQDLRDQRTLAGFDREITLAPVRLYLEKMLDNSRSASGFLSGGVTFGAMLPMRAVPFKIVCLLGMNDGAYPRPARRVSFDLMARDPRPGDRSVRNDDRYLFLETLLSARDQLYISFVGQSPRDSQKRPPSVLVSGLLDYLAKKTGAVKQDDPFHGLVVETSLQPFEPGNFKASAVLPSFSHDNLLAARSLLGPRRLPRPLVMSPLPAPAESYRQVAIDNLCACFTHPAKYFCRERLGIHLAEPEEVLEDQEPFDLDGLARYQLGTAMTDWRLAGGRLADFLPTARAQGLVPPGGLGEAFFSELAGPIETLVSRVAPLLTEPLPDLAVALTMPGFRIEGRLAGIGCQGLVAFRPATLKANDLIRAWIRHLLLNLIAAPGYPGQSLIVGTDQIIGLRPVARAEEILIDLLDRYWQGLCRPLAFFPKSSRVLAERLAKGDDQATALCKAQGKWEGSEWQPGESADPYYELCFDGVACLDQVFVEQSLGFFAPLFDHVEKAR